MRRLPFGPRLALPALLIALVGGGCLLSGTFTVDETFTFEVQEGLYFHAADVTDKDEWQEHKDDIDNVDMVGFELWMTNHQNTAAAFSIYVDDFGETQWGSGEEVRANAVKVFGDLALKPGEGVQTHITYGESLGMFSNVAELRRLAREGRFHVYGVSTASAGSQFTIDSARVIVTFTASVH